METKRSIILSALRSWCNGPKFILIDSEHYTSDVSAIFLAERTYFNEYHVIGSYGRIIEWVKHYPNQLGCMVVISNKDYADDMAKIRPDLEIRKVTIPKEVPNE